MITEDTQDAFVETNSAPVGRTVKNIRLAVNEDGSIDWDSTAEKHKDAFINAINVDANGILQNIQEQASEGPSSDPDGTASISDGVVLTCANIVLILEAIGFVSIGQKYVPVLKHLHPAVAIKACAVSQEDLTPIMPAAKRMIKRYVPMDYLSQEYQDIFIVGEHLATLSALKFKQCVELAQEIEKMKHSAYAGKPNGQVIDATPVDDKDKVQ